MWGAAQDGRVAAALSAVVVQILCAGALESSAAWGDGDDMCPGMRKSVQALVNGKHCPVQRTVSLERYCSLLGSMSLLELSPEEAQMLVSLKFRSWVYPGSPPVSNPSPNKAISFHLLALTRTSRPGVPQILTAFLACATC